MSASRENIAPLSKEKFIELFKPTFLPGNILIEAIYEAREVVYLRFIDHLDHELLGLQSPRLVKSYIALLQLVTHNYFTKKHVWVLQEYAFTEEYVKNQTIILAKSIYESLQPVRAELAGIPNEDARQARLKEAVDIFKKPQIIALREYFMARNDVYGGNFGFENEYFDRLIEKIIMSKITADDNVEVINARVFSALKAFMISSNLTLADEFNFTNLHRVIDKSVNAELPDIDGFRDIFEVYQNYLLDFSAYLKEVSSEIEKVFPNFRIKLFDASYKKAFENIYQNNTCFRDNYIIEMYMQQIRKPYLFDEITDYLMNADKHIVSEVLKATPPDSPPPVPSLQQILRVCYNQLWSEQPELTGCNTLNNFVYVPANEEPPVQVEDVTPILSDHMRTSQFSTQLLTLPAGMILTELFDGEAVPGIVTTMEISILDSFNKELQLYQLHYKNLSKLPMNAPQHSDRKTATDKYLKDFNEANTLAKKAALLTAAKPYINRHKHFDLDKLLGKDITNTWSKILKVAREKAMQSLKSDINRLDDKSAVAALQSWRKMGIFSQHRSNFKILGAFGRTSAQKEIDEMIESRQPRNG